MSLLNVGLEQRPLKLQITRGVRHKRKDFPRRPNVNLIAVLISIGISLAVTTFGYAVARKYVRDRLKYVDAVQTMKAPIIAGLVAWALFMPLTIFPLLGSFIGLGTAIVFGLSVGLGVRAGANDIRVGRLSGGF
jgi:hypothetical protein